MPIALPMLRSKYSQGLTVCARALDPKRKTRHFPDHEADSKLFAETQSKPTLHVRLMWDDAKHKHVHLYILKKDEIDPDNLSPVNSTPEAIVRTLDSFLGTRVDGFMYGRYKLPVSRLGETSLVRSTFFEVGKGEVEIKLVKGTIAFSGTPIRTLAWQIDRGGKTVVVDLDEWIEEMTIQDNFLRNIYKKIDHTFRVFVLGEDEDDSE